MIFYWHDQGVDVLSQVQECQNNKEPDKTGVEPQGGELYKLQTIKWYWCWREVWDVIMMKRLNKDKTDIKVRGSTNGISNKYNINSFYYSIGNHTQRRFQ